MDLGKLEKMKILAFKDNAYSKPAIPGSFPVLVNPESYSLEYSIEYNTDSPTGNNGTPARYTRHAPEEFSCELWFDNTGLLDGIARPDVHKEIEGLKKFLLDMDSETHQPRFTIISWGTLLFKGRIKSLNIEYKLFKPNGTPIRAMATATWTGSVDDILRISKANLLSPDLTSVHIVLAGDTLPNLCEEKYGSTKYVNAIARVNNLTNYRNLEVGTEVIFPPFDKNTAS